MRSAVVNIFLGFFLFKFRDKADPLAWITWHYHKQAKVKFFIANFLHCILGKIVSLCLMMTNAMFFGNYFNRKFSLFNFIKAPQTETTRLPIICFLFIPGLPHSHFSLRILEKWGKNMCREEQPHLGNIFTYKREKKFGHITEK